VSAGVAAGLNLASEEKKNLKKTKNQKVVKGCRQQKEGVSS
jgi:hypothetical protein